MSGVIAGEELSIYELLNLMMVPSGNDAALALAEYVGDGDIQKFVDLMNEKAQELGCQDTHFMNPHGLHDEQHYTTARDMAIITQAAMKEPYFMEITNQVYYTLRATNKSSQPRTVYTTNRMINQNADGGQYYYRYCRGIKTGSHDEAGYCVVTTAVREDLGYSYLCVAMHCPEYTESGEYNVHGEMIDSKNLYQWAFNNLSLKTILESGSVVGEVGLEYAWEKDTVQVLASQSFSTILPDSVDASSIVVKTELPETIEAPVKKGNRTGHRYPELCGGGVDHSGPGGGRDGGAQRTAVYHGSGQGGADQPVVFDHGGSDWHAVFDLPVPADFVPAQEKEAAACEGNAAHVTSLSKMGNPRLWNGSRGFLRERKIQMG